MRQALAGLLAFAEGAGTGAGWVALLSLLDVVPRLTRLTYTKHRIRLYEGAILGGAFLAALYDTLGVTLDLPVWTTAAAGFFMGVSVGLLAAALAEVLNVLPIVGRRFQVEHHMPYLVGALILGKTLGSMVQWLVPGIR